MEDALAAAETVGYPVLLRPAPAAADGASAAATGPEDLPLRLRRGRAEAKACFGDDEMYLEKAGAGPPAH